MPAQGYQYNRPGSQGASAPSFNTSAGPRPQGGVNGQGSSGSQNDFNGQVGSRPGTQAGAQGGRQGAQKSEGPAFGSPRQPPSFSEQEGYKY